MQNQNSSPRTAQNPRRRAATARTITYGAMIAAAYVILTQLCSLFPGNISGFVRLSEALCVLVIFTPAAIPGVTVGCLLANLFCGGMPLDIVCGTAVTLCAALVGYFLRRRPFLVPLPTVVFNAFVIPKVLQIAYGMSTGYWALFISVGAGEVVSAYLFGMLLYGALRKIKFKLS